MDILLINTMVARGGAARAASRLNCGLRQSGINSQLLVQFQTGAEPGVVGPKRVLRKQLDLLRPHLDVLPLRLYPRRQQTPWSLGWLPNPFLQFGRLAPDLVHLHWIGKGFVPLRTISRLGRPLVWTFHDSGAFTGGCHLPGDCRRFEQACGACPQLGSSRQGDLSRRVWRRKERLYGDVDLTVVAPSRWMAECARKSSLLRGRRIEVIPNGLCLETFKPLDRQWGRQLLGLSQDKRVVLFGAVDATADRNKGFDLLQGALRRFAAGGGAAELAVFGAYPPEDTPDLGLPIRYLGPLHDEVSLAALYAAADVFVLPSRQENLPNTLMEAMACGTPCVAFNVGGIPEMIDHEQNGYLAAPGEEADLARGIAWVLESPERHQRLAAGARKKAERSWHLEDVVGRYTDLYRDLLARCDRDLQG